MFIINYFSILQRRWKEKNKKESVRKWEKKIKVDRYPFKQKVYRGLSIYTTRSVRSEGQVGRPNSSGLFCFVQLCFVLSLIIEDENIFFMLFGWLFFNFEENFSLLYSGLSLDIIAVLRRLSRRNLVGNESFFEAVIPRYQSDESRSHFRLKRCTFDSLVMVVVGTGYLPLENNWSRRHIIDPTWQVLAAVWMLSTPECHRSGADRFNIMTSNVHLCLHRVCKALVSVRTDYISWPQGKKCVL